MKQDKRVMKTQLLAQNLECSKFSVTTGGFGRLFIVTTVLGAHIRHRTPGMFSKMALASWDLAKCLCVPHTLSLHQLLPSHARLTSLPYYQLRKTVHQSVPWNLKESSSMKVYSGRLISTRRWNANPWLLCHSKSPQPKRPAPWTTSLSALVCLPPLSMGWVPSGSAWKSWWGERRAPLPTHSLSWGPYSRGWKPLWARRRGLVAGEREHVDPLPLLCFCGSPVLHTSRCVQLPDST